MSDPNTTNAVGMDWNILLGEWSEIARGPQSDMQKQAKECIEIVAAERNGRSPLSQLAQRQLDIIGGGEDG
jgi:hypothetical protein